MSNTGTGIIFKVPLIKPDPYWMRVLVGLDMFGAVILDLPFDITISSWLGLHKGKTWWGTDGSAILNFIQKGHTDGAIIHDKERIEQTEGYLDTTK